MSAPEAPTAVAAAYVKLLRSLQALESTPNEAAIVGRIARFAVSPEVLKLIAATGKWYARWEVRDALLQNPAAPDPLREVLGTSAAVIDLLRDFDRPDLPPAEREELREDIRSLLHGLPPIDRDAIKAHARTMAAGTASLHEPGATLGDLAQRTASQATEEAVRQAARTTSEGELRTALEDRRERVRRAVLENPALIATSLLAALQQTQNPSLLTEVVNTPRWSMLDDVRRAIVANAHTPGAVKAVFEDTAGLMLSLMRYYNQSLEPRDRSRMAKGILGQIQELPEHERNYLRYKMGETWPTFLKEVTRLIGDEVRQARPHPPTPPPAAGSEPRSLAPEPPPPPPVSRSTPVPTPPVEPAGTFDDQRHSHTPMHQRPISVDTRRALAHLPYDQRTVIARTTRDTDELNFLLHDADDRVFAALLNNPHVQDLDLVAIARGASRERVAALVASGRYVRPAIKAALLLNPHTPEAVQLECLDHVGALRDLMVVMRDPRVRSLEVKAKARARLHDRYRAMAPAERVAAIKQTGGDILQDLWSEAFSDEPTLHALVQDRALEEPIVLRLVRSRIAPRQVLAAIGRNSALLASYQVVLELARNPKTPRDIVLRLIPRLAPADRQRLKASSHTSEFVRDIA